MLTEAIRDQIKEYLVGHERELSAEELEMVMSGVMHWLNVTLDDAIHDSIAALDE